MRSGEGRGLKMEKESENREIWCTGICVRTGEIAKGRVQEEGQVIEVLVSRKRECCFF